MADVLSAVRTYLLAQSSVTDLVGQRIYFDVIKQNATLPAIALTKISEVWEHTLSDKTQLRRSRLQFDCFSSLRLTSNAIADAINTSGIVAVKGLTNSVNIRGVMIEDGQRNTIEYDSEGGDDHRYVTSFDLMVSTLG